MARTIWPDGFCLYRCRQSSVLSEERQGKGILGSHGKAIELGNILAILDQDERKNHGVFWKLGAAIRL